MPELTRRYIVMAMAAEGPFDIRDPDGAFVLKPWKDPAAMRALQAYRELCYPELAAELGAWLEAIASGPTVRGGVGARNDRHMAESARRSATRKPAPKRKATTAARRTPKARKPTKKRKR